MRKDRGGASAGSSTQRSPCNGSGAGSKGADKASGTSVRCARFCASATEGGGLVQSTWLALPAEQKGNRLARSLPHLPIEGPHSGFGPPVLCRHRVKVADGSLTSAPPIRAAARPASGGSRPRTRTDHEKSAHQSVCCTAQLLRPPNSTVRRLGTRCWSLAPLYRALCLRTPRRRIRVRTRRRALSGGDCPRSATSGSAGRLP